MQLQVPAARNVAGFSRIHFYNISRTPPRIGISTTKRRAWNTLHLALFDSFPCAKTNYDIIAFLPSLYFSSLMPHTRACGGIPRIMSASSSNCGLLEILCSDSNKDGVFRGVCPEHQRGSCVRLQSARTARPSRHH